MEQTIKEFLFTRNRNSALKILDICETEKLNSLGSILSLYFMNIFACPKLMFYEKKFTGQDASNLIHITMDHSLAHSIVKYQFENFDKNADFTSYNIEIVEKIKKRPNNPLPLITLTITTCKRYDLFVATMNSFLNCCQDLLRIDYWICVDDHSEEQDIEKMRQLYPFLTIVPNPIKGHANSMNIIRDVVQTPYIFHMEDDWKFIQKRNYITECMTVLNSNDNIGQCLLNRNYAEVNLDCVGGIPCEINGIRYYIHEHAKNTEEQQTFNKKYSGGVNCAYWPHFSFRPSLVKRNVYLEFGKFNYDAAHFEMEYARKYSTKYVSAFLEGIYCLHTGRLTSEIHDKTKLNAYILNGETQFVEKPLKATEWMQTFVINMDRRPDRWNEFSKHSAFKCLNYTRFPAIDGNLLIPSARLNKIFEGNDYRMRKGIVGCALSHIQLMINHLKQNTHEFLCVLEDDAKPIVSDEIFKKVVMDIFGMDFDLCYLGHHCWKPENNTSKNGITFMKASSKQALEYSMGGTTGYIISRNGCEKLLNFIEIHGMTNAIDTIQQKSGDILNLYYTVPSIIFADVYTLTNSNVDTDIQKNHTSLYDETIGMTENRLKNHGEYDISKVLKYRNFLSIGDNTHVSEALCSRNNLFDLIEDSSLETNLLILETIYDMTETEIESFVKDFTDVSKGTIYVQNWNNRTVFKNTMFSVSFPHEDINDLFPIYLKKFLSFQKMVKEPNVILLHSSRISKIPKVDFLKKHNIPFFNIAVEFPEHLAASEWTPKKIHYDQNIYRVAVQKRIQNFIENF